MKGVRVNLRKVRSKYCRLGNAGVKYRPGMKFIYATEGDERVVAMVTFRNKIVIATTKQVLMYPKPKKKKK